MRKLTMKYILLLPLLMLCSCDGAYDKEVTLVRAFRNTGNWDSVYLYSDGHLVIIQKEEDYGDTLTGVVTASGKYFNGVDTIDFNLINCDYKIKKPYTLIQWNDGTYGILKKAADIELEWYKTQNGFATQLEHGEHFIDSCKAKENLKQYLDTKITYKVVK